MKTLEKYNKITKGLSISIIVLSAISIIISMIALVYLLIAFNAASSYENAHEVAQSAAMPYGTYTDGNDIFIGEKTESISQLTTQGLFFMLAISLFTFLTSLFSLTLSIIGIALNEISSIKQKLYVMHIFSAILSILSVCIIRGIVTIVASIYYYKIIHLEKIQAKHL